MTGGQVWSCLVFSKPNRRPRLVWAALAASPLSQLPHKPEVSTGSKGELDHNNQHRVDAGQKPRRFWGRGNPVKKSINTLISLSLSVRALTLSVIQPIVPTVTTERDRALVDLESFFSCLPNRHGDIVSHSVWLLDSSISCISASCWSPRLYLRDDAKTLCAHFSCSCQPHDMEWRSWSNLLTFYDTLKLQHWQQKQCY